MGVPTKKPRLMLAVEPELHRVIKRLSELQGVSMASIATDILEAALPALVDLLNAVERVQQLPEEARASVIEKVRAVEATLVQASEEADRQLDLVGLALAAVEGRKGA